MEDLRNIGQCWDQGADGVIWKTAEYVNLQHDVMPVLTANEANYCEAIAERMSKLRSFLNDNSLKSPPDAKDWHAFISMVRGIVGNLSNDGSSISTLMAKQYLSKYHGVEFDAADKPQGAPGIDIDVVSSSDERIVAEIKTTVPYGVNDFGAQQAAMFKKDFAKLKAANAPLKFMFVTDARAFSVLLKDKYAQLMPGVRIVNLVTEEHHVAE